MRNRIFFPQEAVEMWMVDDRVDLSSEELTLRPDNRRYRVVEAVRVLREITDGSDPNELIGKVKSRAFLAELGAEVMEGSMILGDNAYDVIQGFAGAPATTFEEHKKASPETTAASDEEFLASFASG